MKRALGFAAWAVSLALGVSSCVLRPATEGTEPEATPPAVAAEKGAAAEPAPAEKPAPAPPKAPAAPEAAPAKEAAGPAVPAAPPTLYFFSPQERQCFVGGETAEFTLVVVARGAIPQATATLTVTSEAGETWTATDNLGDLSPGRHSLTWGINVGCFAQGTYKVAARLGEQATEPRSLTVASSVPQTHFRTIGRIDKPPKSQRDALRWSRAMGLNTLLFTNHSPWRAEGTHVMDASLLASSRQIALNPEAKPLEAGWTAPPYVGAADLLTGAGLQWLDACVVSGGTLPPMRPKRDFSDPRVVLGGRQRVQHRMAAGQRFGNFAGVHFTDEGALARTHSGEGVSPFGVPSQIEGFKKLSGVKDVSWREGSRKWDEWNAFMRYRAGVFGEALANWAAAAREVLPDALATSTFYDPTELGEGVYPPLSCSGLPILSPSVSLTGPAGVLMPAIVADLLPAGNWGRPVWFMPELRDDADLDETRVGIYLALARKISGVIYPPNVDYHLDRPSASQLSTDLLWGIGGVNHLLTRFGDFLLALEKPRSEVAVFYSVAEHIDRIGRDPVADPQAPAYPWTVLTAYASCMLAHFPATFLTEEGLLAGEGAKSKIILLVGIGRMLPEVKAALEAYIANGGVVLTDNTTKVTIEGARKLDLAFPDIQQYQELVMKKAAEEKLDPTPLLRDVVVQNSLIYPLLPVLRTEIKRYVDRDYTATDPDILVCDQRCGASRYVFAINDTQRADAYAIDDTKQVEFFRGLKWEFAAGQTRLIFRKQSYAIYDVIRGMRLYPGTEKGNLVLPRVLAPGDLDIFALLPEPIRRVRITRASHSRSQLSLGVNVYGPERPLIPFVPYPTSRKLIDGAVPIEITVADAAGREALHIYRTHLPNRGYQETLPFPTLGMGGRWTLTVRELLSGLSATTTFRVTRSSPAWASRRGRLAVFGGDRIAAVLRSSRPLWIIVGTADEAAKAEPLAAALRTGQRTVDIKLAADVARDRSLSADEAAAYVSAAPTSVAMPDVRQDAILLGNVATHPLLQAVHNYGVLPRAVTPDYPGPGGALLCLVPSAFEPDAVAVVAAAADEAGVHQALEALLGAARDSAPRTAWASLPTGHTAAQADPKAKPEIQTLKPEWRVRTTDNPVSAASSLPSETFVVGCYDGMVVAYEPIGKSPWDRRCTSRVRAVARSLDGLWTAAASFPEVRMLTALGRPQFEKFIEEPSWRADFTAVAVAADGAFLAAGTRRGEVFAYDMQGQKIVTVGDKDADETAEGWQSRFGPIADVSIALKTGTIVAGGELGTVAVDPKGQELWASKELNRVTSLATSLNEEQTVAVGSRSGYVACVSGGNLLWRKATGSYVTSVCFRGTTQDVLATSLDGTLTCFDKDGGVLWTHQSPVGYRFVGSSADGALVAAAELAGKVVLFNRAGKPIAETAPLEAAIRAFTFTPDGQYIVVGTAANEVMLFKYNRPRADVDEL